MSHLRGAVQALMRASPVPGQGIDASETPDGLVLHHAGLEGVDVTGPLAVYMSNGGVAVVPGEVRFEYAIRSLFLGGLTWSPAFEGLVDWEGGAASDIPRALLSQNGVVALKMRVKAYLGAEPVPMPPPENPPALAYLPLPLPARIWGALPGMESIYYIPIALVEASGTVHQLTLGPLTVGDLGRSVRVRRHYQDFTA